MQLIGLRISVFTTMKQRLLLPLLLACCVAQQSHAEDIDVLYMITTLSSGTKKEVMLTNDMTFVGPKIYRENKLFVIDGTNYASDDIKEIRFEQRTIDAIVSVESENVQKHEDNAVYNLNGQKICDLSTYLLNPSVLKKGMYIVNGKKMLINK